MVEELRKILKNMPPKALIAVGVDTDGTDHLLATVVHVGWWEPRPDMGVFHREEDVTDFPDEWQPNAKTPQAVAIVRVC